MYIYNNVVHIEIKKENGYDEVVKKSANQKKHIVIRIYFEMLYTLYWHLQGKKRSKQAHMTALILWNLDGNIPSVKDKLFSIVKFFKFKI